MRLAGRSIPRANRAAQESDLGLAGRSARGLGPAETTVAAKELRVGDNKDSILADSEGVLNQLTLYPHLANLTGIHI